MLFRSIAIIKNELDIQDLSKSLGFQLYPNINSDMLPNHAVIQNICFAGIEKKKAEPLILALRKYFCDVMPTKHELNVDTTLNSTLGQAMRWATVMKGKHNTIEILCYESYYTNSVGTPVSLIQLFIREQYF